MRIFSTGKTQQTQQNQLQEKKKMEIVADPFDHIDVRIVMGQASCTKEQAIEALKKSKGLLISLSCLFFIFFFNEQNLLKFNKIF